MTATVNGSRGCVLVVEDHEASAFVTEQMLDMLDYTSEHAPDGQAAVDKVNADNRYAAILMDIEMPVMDGMTATRLIRETETAKDLPRMPIIGATGHTSRGIQVLGVNAGMDGFLLKPYTLAQLEETLLRFGAVSGHRAS